MLSARPTVEAWAYYIIDAYPHFNGIVLDGGSYDESTFYNIPFSGLDSMVEVFR